jgi:hypothetical protein
MPEPNEQGFKRSEGNLFWSYNQSPVNILQFLLGVLKQKLERLIRGKEALSLYVESVRGNRQ